MAVWGFDSKEFTRTKSVAPIAGELDSPKTEPKRERVFHTPLGIGISTQRPADFQHALVDALGNLKAQRGIDSKRPFAPSTIIRKWCQDRIGASVSEAERIVDVLAPFVSKMHVSFAALSPTQMPTVPIGGYASPRRDMPTTKFVEAITPFFSYLTAWSAKEASVDFSDDELRIDSFLGKQTYAWTELTSVARPRIVFRGDEVDPLISAADLFAFVTDRILYRTHRQLRVENVADLWGEKGLKPTTWLIGKGNLTRVAWSSRDDIDVGPFLHHPITFLLVDRPEAYRSMPPSRKGRPQSYSSFVQGGQPFEAAVEFAVRNRTALKFFHEYEDAEHIRDGDFFVYAGKRAQEVVELQKDMYAVEAFSFQQLRQAK